MQGDCVHGYHVVRLAVAQALIAYIMHEERGKCRTAPSF
jgi:hypothetical protein